MRSLFSWLLSYLEVSHKPILSRYYLIRSKRYGFGVKLHHIHQSDPEFHNHPWWGLSIIFGWYYEERLPLDVFEARCRGDLVDYFGPRKRLRIGLNIVSPWTPHRVITDRPVWTLFIHGPRVNEKWKYGCDEAPWRGPGK